MFRLPGSWSAFNALGRLHTLPLDQRLIFVIETNEIPRDIFRMQPVPIIALDTSSPEVLAGLLARIPQPINWFKIGLQLYSALGPESVSRVRRIRPDCRIMLDLKLHDIPNTVASALEALAPVSPDIVTVHASGGAAMLQAAVERARKVLPGCRLAAVTVLTSLDCADLAVVAAGRSPAGYARALAQLAYAAGIRTFVAAVDEVADLKRELGSEICCICPGIRFGGQEGQDQKRVATPARAREAGAEFVVVGRAVTAAADPAAACRTLLEELQAGS